MKLTRYLLAVALTALTTGAHAQAISALTGASALSGSEVTAVVQSATTKKATVDQFRTYILGGNTWTAGTGTLTLGAGKTATISNTLTFAGTDGSTLNVGTGGTLGTAAYTASSAYEAAGVALLKASNLSDLTSASTARTNLGLGTLATQSGTFSGTSSGTNTGDQTTITGNAGTATALQTARAIYGNNFDGTAALTQIIASTFGGTGNGFTKFSGPTTTERTFTLPDADATILYSGGNAGTPSALVCTNCTGMPAAGVTGTALTLAGGTLAGHLLFTDNTYDIGASGATRPRALYVAGAGTFGGQVAAAAGSTSAAAYSFVGDPNTGMYSAGADSVQIVAGGVMVLSSGTSALTLGGGVSSITLGATTSLSGLTLSAFSRNVVDGSASGSDNNAGWGTGIVHNTGASALSTRTLPAAGAGKSYTYYVSDADGIKIQTAGSDTIRISTKVTAGGGYLQSTAIGSSITIACVGTVNWVAIAVTGTWTDGTFTFSDAALLTP